MNDRFEQFKSGQSDRNRVPWLCLAISLILIFIASRYSVGFPHPDEHFQVIEFAGYKMGVVPSSSLTWEFQAMARSWLQPGFLVLLGWFNSLTANVEPIEMAFVFRLLSGLFCFLALGLFVKSLAKLEMSDTLLVFAQWATVLFCFIPYLAVRTSSEVFSACWMLLALALVAPIASGHKCNLPSHFLLGLSGFLWGLGFLARFQLGFMFGAFFLWLYFIHKARAKDLLMVSGGFVLANLIGVLLDHWGYGVFSSSAWNYFKVNLLEGRAASFGVDPWWSYLKFILKELPTPLGFLTLSSWLMCWLLFPRHLFSWISLAFFCGHSAVGHKEPRFLYPLFFIAPSMLAIALSHPKALKVARTCPLWLKQFAITVIVMVNGLALIKLITKPIKSDLAALEAIVADQDSSHLVCAVWLDKEPVGGQGDLAIRYYVPLALDIHVGKRLDFQLENPCPRGFYLYGRRSFNEIDSLSINGFSTERCEKIFSDPIWLLWYLPGSFIDSFAEGEIKEAWRCS